MATSISAIEPRVGSAGGQSNSTESSRTTAAATRSLASKVDEFSVSCGKEVTMTVALTPQRDEADEIRIFLASYGCDRDARSA